MIAHLGVVIDGEPLVVPTVFGYDPFGPDTDGTLYVHGSVASRSLLESDGEPVCVTVTLLDGLVAARSAFHHSMNYRSAVVRGEARAVVDPEERRKALDLVVDHAVPGRSATLRDHLRKELAATHVLAVPLHEAAVKTRTGGPVDDDADIDAGSWAGVLTLATTVTGVQPDAFSAGYDTPVDVRTRAEQILVRSLAIGESD